MSLIIALALIGFVSVAAPTSNSIAGVERYQASNNCTAGYPIAMNVITTTPSTFEVDIEEEARQRLNFYLENDSLKIARLYIRDLRPDVAQALEGVRVFIEKPDADVNTPIDDPHYASSFVLGLEDSQSMILNIAPTLSKLWYAGDLSPERLAGKEAMQITFVPHPLDFVTALPENFTLPFRCLTFEVPSQP